MCEKSTNDRLDVAADIRSDEKPHLVTGECSAIADLLFLQGSEDVELDIQPMRDLSRYANFADLS